MEADHPARNLDHVIRQRRLEHAVDKLRRRQPAMCTREQQRLTRLVWQPVEAGADERLQRLRHRQWLRWVEISSAESARELERKERISARGLS